jgi:hypothetical protein
VLHPAITVPDQFDADGSHLESATPSPIGEEGIRGTMVVRHGFGVTSYRL